MLAVAQPLQVFDWDIGPFLAAMPAEGEFRIKFWLLAPRD